MKKLCDGKNGFVAKEEGRNSIEIYFNSIPDQSIRDSLKLLGWRYQGYKHCWYNRYSEENMIVAKGFAGENSYQLDEIGFDQIIGVQDIVVITSMLSCIHRNHKLMKAKALISVLAYGRIREVSAPAFFCPDCGVYYMLSTDFKAVRESGYLCCKVITVEDYRKLNGEYDWAPRSIMRSYGYTVNASDDLSTSERREILAFLVENNIMSAVRISEYLNWFIRRAQNNPYMKHAINKWSEDREYVLGYVSGNISIRVRKVFLKAIS